jgi:DNA-directed RNA polymerase subunit alpha
VLLTRERYNEVLHEVDSAMRGFPVASIASLSDPVSALDLSSRTRHCLSSARINTIDHLCRLSAAELLDIKRFGPVCLSEVRERLSERGLVLRDDP